MAGLAPEQREQAGEIDADEPVGAGARERAVVEGERVVRGPQRAECLADRRIVERRQPQALDRSAVAAVVDQFAGDHLAFAIGVRGDDELGRLCQQPLNDLELRGAACLDDPAPLRRNDRQRLQRPALEVLAVGLRGRGLDQVADAPGDFDARPTEATGFALVCAQDPGDVLALGRLLAEHHAHQAASRRKCMTSIEWPSASRVLRGVAAHNARTARSGLPRRRLIPIAC